jgi:hypothetical protein
MRNAAALTMAVFLFTEALPARQMVRLTAPGLGRRHGLILEQDTAELVFTNGREPLRVPAVSIDTLWTRGRSTGVGALVGAILGAGLGVLAGSELGEENAGSARNVLGMVGIGAVGGGLLGAVIGTPIPRWKRRFP